MDEMQNLRLLDFRPRSELRLPEHHVSKPPYPIIDAHNHLGKDDTEKFSTLTPEKVLSVLDEVGVETMVDLDGGWGDALDARVSKYGKRFPDRFVHFVRMDSPHPEGENLWSVALSKGNPGEYAAEQLRDAIGRGVRGLKVWKNFGLRTRDSEGKLVPIDDERFDPLWDTAGELGVPVLIHVGDPAAFFRPLDATNERIPELLRHPDWHFYPDFPSLEEIISQLEGLVLRHPGTTFIGAHVGCFAEDLARVGALMDRAPNWHIDISARVNELGRQPRATRALIEAHPDRVLFGTDNLAFNLDMYPIWYRFLETEDEYFPFRPASSAMPGLWRIYGIGLPEDLLRSVYRENARRVLHL